MTNDFYILGSFVNTTSERECEEDLTPQIFKKAIYSLKAGDELVIHCNSCGGDVNSGLSIANMIQNLNVKGVKTTCIVEGLCASIASVVACACQKVKMCRSSFLMIHNAWTVVQGNSNDLRKEAEVMDKINRSMLNFYHNHFSLTDEQIKKLMDEETWIGADEIGNYGFDAEIVDGDHSFKIAASLKGKKFSNIPKGLIMEAEKTEEKTTEEIEKIEKVEKTEEQADKAEETTEETKTEETAEKPSEEKTEDDEKKETTEAKAADEFVTKAECEMRVSGMQSTMAKKLDALKKEYEAKIEEFNGELKAKDEELNKAKAEFTSLQTKLEETAKEFSAMKSAFEAKDLALKQLNSAVNTPNQEKPVDWQKLKGEEFYSYLRKHPEIVNK